MNHVSPTIFSTAFWAPHLHHLFPVLGSNSHKKYGTSQAARDAYLGTLKWLQDLDSLSKDDREEWILEWLGLRVEGLRAPNQGGLQIEADGRKGEWIEFYEKERSRPGRHTKVMGDHLTAEMCYQWALLMEDEVIAPALQLHNEIEGASEETEDENVSDSISLPFDYISALPSFDTDLVLLGAEPFFPDPPTSMPFSAEEPLLIESQGPTINRNDQELLLISCTAWFEHHQWILEKDLIVIEEKWRDHQWRGIIPLILGQDNDAEGTEMTEWERLSESHQSMLMTLSKSYPFLFVQEMVQSWRDSPSTSKGQNLPVRELQTMVATAWKEKEETELETLPAEPVESVISLSEILKESEDLTVPYLVQSVDMIEGLLSPFPMTEIVSETVYPESLFGRFIRPTHGSPAARISLECNGPNGVSRYRLMLDTGILVLPSDCRWKISAIEGKEISLLQEAWLHPSLVIPSLRLLNSEIARLGKITATAKEAFLNSLEHVLVNNERAEINKAIENEFRHRRAKENDEEGQAIAKKRKSMARKSQEDRENALRRRVV